MPSATPAQLDNAKVAFGERILWEHVNLTVHPGEFIAVLGPNGVDKTTMLRVLLGQTALSEGTARVNGKPVRPGSRDIGYIPQQRTLDALAPVRGRDLVGMGIDGHRWGPGWPSRTRRRRIAEVIERVGASAYADSPISVLSGGEQQRLRIAQALVSEPVLMLCDEPLLSLDIHHQQAVTRLIDQARRDNPLGVLFVTHEINPILPFVDRVVYVANGGMRIGTPDEVLRTEVLTDLFGSPVEVFQHGDRIIVLADEEQGRHVHGENRER